MSGLAPASAALRGVLGNMLDLNLQNCRLISVCCYSASFCLLPLVPAPGSTASAQGWVVRACLPLWLLLLKCSCWWKVSFCNVSWANEVSTLTGQGFESWRNPGVAFFLCPICSAWIMGCTKSVKSFHKEASSLWLIQTSKVQMRNEERKETTAVLLPMLSYPSWEKCFSCSVVGVDCKVTSQFAVE